MWQARATEPEIIDLGPKYYSVEEYNDCLKKLDRVSRWLGGDSATFSALSRLSSEPLSILDVGCGGGAFTSRLAQRYPQAHVVGIDINPLAIEFAKQRVSAMPVIPKNLVFECKSEAKLNENRKSYDIVLSTLVCHHLSDEDLVDFISRALAVAKKRVIINDLHRHPMAFYLFKSIGPLFFNNRLIQHDGPLSVRKAFTYKDWMHYLKSAGLSPSQFSIQWHYAFRWLVSIDLEGISS